MTLRSYLRDQLSHHSSLLLLIVPMLVLAVGASLFGTTVFERIVTVLFINLMLVIALQMFMGNSGVFSFAHIGLMGIGAYVSVIFSMSPVQKSLALPQLYPFLVDIHLPILLAIILAATVTTVLAAIVSFPLMRLSGPASAIATFALLVITHVIFLNWVQITNGSRTIFGITRHTSMWVSVSWASLFVILAYWFKESPLGLQLRATREDEQAARSIGINIVVVRWIAFSLSAFVAAVAGALWAHFVTTFSPNAFYLKETFLIVTMLIIGGSGSVSGALVGTFAVTAIYEGLRAFENINSLQQIVPMNIAGMTEVLLAIALIVILIYRPAGITRGQELYWPGRARLRRIPPELQGAEDASQPPAVRAS
jgi:branched-chain amino acid transport system permease protein